MTRTMDEQQSSHTIAMLFKYKIVNHNIILNEMNKHFIFSFFSVYDK